MKVYKYRGGAFDRDLASLRDNQFYASCRKNLNDPCECLFDQDVIFAQTELISMLIKSDSNNAEYERLVSSLRDVFAFIDKSGIYSLCDTPLQELLWAHYSYNHTGFCIEYDLDKLSEFIDRDCNVMPVTYKTCPPEIFLSDLSSPGDIIKKMFGVKSMAWSYENETRLVTSQEGMYNYDFRAVTGIYFGLRMDEAEKQKIMQTLKGRGVKYYQISLKGNTYELACNSIQDVFVGSERYMYNIAPVADSAIDENNINVQYKMYLPYLYKATEIVRREPYCSRVEFADFSASKGNFSEPVIFVQYVNLDGNDTTKYLPVKDIDAVYKQLSDIEENAI